MRHCSTIVVSFAVASLFSITAVAASIDRIVEDRRNDMKEMAVAAKNIAAMFKTPETYVARRFEQAALTISEHADSRLTAHFQTVTSANGSKANDSIAGERGRFDALAADLKTYADRLASSAAAHPLAMTEDMRMSAHEPMGGGPLGTGIRDQAALSSMSAEHAFHMMLQTCTSCHARFRLPDN